jgi:hypothetical protein
MATTTIWDFMTVEGSPAAVAATGPYLSKGGHNYYELYSKSTRNTNKREHATYFPQIWVSLSLNFRRAASQRP